MLLADFNFSQLNTWMVGGFGLITTFAAAGSLIASFRSRSLKVAMEAVRVSNEALKTELQACGERSNRLEADRNDYRDKLHAALQDANAIKLENVELKTRTDFTPVMAFQRTWYEEQARVSRETLSMLTSMTALLESLNDKLENDRA